MTSAEIQILWEQWKSAKGLAKEKLFRKIRTPQNARVKFYTARFRSPTIPIEEDDLRQSAEMGFLRAMNAWQPKRGAFSTCLYIWIRHEVQRAQGHEPVVYRPRCVACPYPMHRKIEAFVAANGHHPEAEDMGVSQKEWDTWQGDLFFSRMSLDEWAEHGGVVLDEYQAAGALCETETPDTLLERRNLQDLLNALSEDERAVLLGPDCEGKDALRERFAEYRYADVP